MGWSAAGLVAYEMARLLQQQGRQVSYTGLIDSGIPIHLPDNDPQADDAAILIGLWARESGIENHETLEEEKLLAMILDSGLKGGYFPEEFTLEHVRRRIQVSASHTHGSKTYQPAPYPGPVYLYRASEASGLDPLGPNLAWDRYVSDLHRVPVTGSHGSVMTPPHVIELVTQIISNLKNSGWPS